MQKLFQDILSSILLYFLLSGILGWGIMNCLLELLDAMGINVKKNRKLKCWIYTSILVFLLAVLIKAFAS